MNDKKEQDTPEHIMGYITNLKKGELVKIEKVQNLVHAHIRAISELYALEESLGVYGRHLSMCPVVNGGQECTCYFDFRKDAAHSAVNNVLDILEHGIDE